MLDWSMPMADGTVDDDWRRRPFDAEYGESASERLDEFHAGVMASRPKGSAFFPDETVPVWAFEFRDGGIAVHPDTQRAVLSFLHSGLRFENG